VAVFAIILVAQETFAQNLPSAIKTYLNRNYAGWKLSPTRKNCDPNINPGFVAGEFDGDGNRDYAVKFSSGDKGYVLAFLQSGNTFKPFVLHNYTAEEARASSFAIWKKGSIFEYNNKKLRLKHDSPSDYFCESDVGGIHYYRNGKFVGY